MKITCGIFANIAPLYSKPLWCELTASTNISYTFYSSGKGYSGIKTIDVNESKCIDPKALLDWHFLTNIIVKNRIIYQKGIISKCLRTDYDAYILYGEMHCISNWIAALICKIRRKPFVFWGHGLYGNEKNFKKRIRLLFYKLADANFVYGNISRNLMIDSGFKPNNVFTVYNSLNFNFHRKLYDERNEMELSEIKVRLFKSRNNLPVILFIGRLTREKKISYLLESISLCKLRGNDFNCLIVGDGEESDQLKNNAKLQGISESVYFYGSSYEETINAKLIMLSDCCVSPGNVGLTAIHSLSLGTPVITHNNIFNQGPEVEAIIQDKTGLFFKENDVTDLSFVIEDFILGKKKEEMSLNCIREINEYWNPLNQTTIIDEAVIKLLQTKRNGIKIAE
jgi:glycosyltransferase involved in cell wall biosynthesis